MSLADQFFWVDGDAIEAAGSGTDPERGVGVDLELGSRFGGDWSGSFGFRYGKSFEESDHFGYYIGGGELEYQEDHIVVDLEIGRDVGIGAGSARLFGGVRFAYFDGDGDLDASYYQNAISAETEHRFIGAGPRLGVEFGMPLADRLTLDVETSASVLFGRQKTDIAVDGGYYAYAYDESDGQVVPNVEASAAVAYWFTPHAGFSAGYRVSQFWHLAPTIEISGTDTSGRLLHGPFVEFTLRDW